MWFSNALIYHYQFKETVDLTQALDGELLKPCPPHARFIYGWLPTYDEVLVHEVTGCSLICLGKEERVLPRAVIQRVLKERIQQIETEQQRNLKRAERAQLAEDLEFELLPKSFCLQKKTFALLDSISQRLIINQTSTNQASQLLALLRKSIPGIQIEPLAVEENLALRFAQWINNPALLPPSFQLASDCLLFSLDDEKKRVNCKGYELSAEEILTLLAQGLAAAEISLIWKERIQFTLTQDLTFKRIKSLDLLMEEFGELTQLEDEYQQRDAQLILLNGELRTLINEIFGCLKGHPHHLERPRHLEPQ